MASLAVVGVLLTGAETTGAYFTAQSSLAGNSASTASLGAPTGLTATWPSNDTSVLSWNSFTWDAPTNQTWARANNVTSGVTYTLQRTYPGQSPTTVYTGQDTSYTDPSPVAESRKFSAISLGMTHALGLAEDGSVWAWGAGGTGALGDGTYQDRLTPVRVTLPARAIQVEAGWGISRVLLEDHTVWSWGMNGLGQLGDNTTTDRSSPVKVLIPDGVTVKQLSESSAQSMTSFALTTNGAVYAWGRNRENQFGNGNTTDVLKPVLAFDKTFASISSGFQSTVGLDADGKVWTWGAGYGYRLGNNSEAVRATPGLVSMPSGVTVTQIANGEGFAVALDSAGKVYTWGTIADSTDVVRRSPTEMTGLTSIGAATRVYAGTNDACALMSAGDLYCWGNNRYGQLQDGTTTDRRNPVRNRWSNPQSHKVKSVSLGDSAALAQTVPSSESETNLWAWGLNSRGTSGNNTTANGDTPTRVKGPDNCVDGTQNENGNCAPKPGTTYTLSYLFRNWASPTAEVTR